MARWIGLMMAGFLVLAGCEYENEEALFGEPEPCATAVFFENDIRELIQTNCALPGCHAAGGTFPELSSFERVHNRAADIRRVTQSGEMPPPASGRSLSQEEIELIACWVEQGALLE
jgi:mono/diheme cytochrome c family protein